MNKIITPNSLYSQQTIQGNDNTDNTTQQVINIPNFKKSLSSTNAPVTDEFIKETNELTEKMYHENILNKLFRLPLLATISALGLLGCEFSVLHNLNKAKKGNNVSENVLENIKSKGLKKFGIATLIVIASNFLAGYIANKNYDKHFAEQKELFNSLNNTHARFSDKTIASTYMGAAYNSISGEVQVNKNFITSPWNRFKSKYMYKHELVHARQHEMVARSKNGIQKLNFAILQNIAQEIKKNEEVVQCIDTMYKELLNDKTHKYDDVNISILNADVNLKDYVTAIHTLCHDENATYKDIPIVINKEHYEAVRKENPPLTQEEELQAEKYYQALIEYPRLNPLKALNPFSSYYKNLLEKEAYKENPWYTRII